MVTKNELVTLACTMLLHYNFDSSISKSANTFI